MRTLFLQCITGSLQAVNPSQEVEGHVGIPNPNLRHIRFDAFQIDPYLMQPLEPVLHSASPRILEEVKQDMEQIINHFNTLLLALITSRNDETKEMYKTFFGWRNGKMRRERHYPINPF
ncbi:hypothetical protein C8J57DRAFT_1215366 [Mycena rebaudengoi]|nr:hypothetical protein C8J57DRAFT_1215366 [Mycena rebaudengoi]